MRDLSTIPPAPRSPSQTANDLLFRIRSTRLIWLIVGALWATGGWIVPGVFAKGIGDDILLTLSSEKATGVITEVKESDGLPINRVYPQSIFYEYVFEGQSLSGLSKTFEVDWAKQLQLGQSVELEVSSLSPSLSRVVGTKRSQYGAMGFFTLAFPVFGFILIGVVLGRRRRELNAYINGASVLAKNITAQKKGNSIWLRWEFEADGRLHFGECLTKAHPALEPLLSAKEFPVIYNPEDPRDNTIYLL
jgi:Protein of unknown function (DUF3592)